MTKQLSQAQRLACKTIFGDADFCNNGDEKMTKSNVDHVDHLERAEQILAPLLAKHGLKSKSGGSHYVPAEPMTGIFATPSEAMLKRREGAAKAVEARRQAEQSEATKQRQAAAAINASLFDTKTVTAGIENFDYSDAEARRREHNRLVAQNIKDRVFRRL